MENIKNIFTKNYDDFNPEVLLEFDDSYTKFRNDFLRLLKNQTYKLPDLYYIKFIYDFWNDKPLKIDYRIFNITNNLIIKFKVKGIDEYSTYLQFSEYLTKIQKDFLPYINKYYKNK